MFEGKIFALFKDNTADYIWAVDYMRVSVEVFYTDKDSGKKFEGGSCLSSAYEYALDLKNLKPEQKKYFRGLVTVLVLAPFISQDLVASRSAPVERKPRYLEQHLSADDFEQNTYEELEAKVLDYFSDKFSENFPR